jgi:hypothetical protein
LTYSYTYLSNVCARFGGAIWVGSWVASSSDTRIKEDIEDINDDSALQMILAIERKNINILIKSQRVIRKYMDLSLNKLRKYYQMR